VWVMGVLPKDKATGACRWPPTPHLAPRLSMNSHTSTTPPCLTGILQGDLYLYISVCVLAFWEGRHWRS
jgi:hypothetical protein